MEQGAGHMGEPQALLIYVALATASIEHASMPGGVVGEARGARRCRVVVRGGGVGGEHGGGVGVDRRLQPRHLRRLVHAEVLAAGEELIRGGASAGLRALAQDVGTASARLAGAVVLLAHLVQGADVPAFISLAGVPVYLQGPPSTNRQPESRPSLASGA